MSGSYRIKRAQWKGWKHAPSVHLSIGKRANEFEACVLVSRKTAGCGFGTNPRRAIANAFAQAAIRIRKRSGAFAGYSKRNRRARRISRRSKRR